ncbi:restriction endonuclease subunit S [Geobacillus zalihae]|uniref:restriction endonuclease subunit S n=1 Tax=Geobacillus zalihae TaxID=213419 RepID=UPI0007640F2E|nr:restriction endonuclease subunit S [Geobacillus zalihae]
MKDLKQIEQYTSYTKYKDSGIEWLGKIPEHWKVSRIEYVANKTLNSIDTKDMKGKELFYYDIPTVQSVNDGRLENGDNIESNKYKLKGGEVLISKLNPRKKTVVLTEKKKQDIVCSTEFVPFYPKKIMGKYLYYILSNSKLADYYNSFVKSATNSHQRVEPAIISKTKIPVPPLDEQRLIADFLDYKTSQIDAIIKEKEQLIEHLQEYRQAIINEAVTKGLSPETAKMKDSGVEWIGEIPEHWGIVKLKYIGEAIIGLTYAPTDVVSESEKGNLVLRSSNIRDGKIVFENNVFVDKIIPDKLKTRAGDILICSRNGSRELIGKCALIDRDSEGLTFGAFMTVFRSQYNKFLYYVFQSQLFKAQIGSFLTSTINQLTIGNLYSFPIALPDKQEQEDIAEYLTKKTTEIDILIEDQRTVINKLKEYRQSLIYEAVTGKIDVRGFQKGE